MGSGELEEGAGDSGCLWEGQGIPSTSIRQKVLTMCQAHVLGWRFSSDQDEILTLVEPIL